MIEKRNRTAEDQVRKIAFSKYDRQIFEEKNKRILQLFSDSVANGKTKPPDPQLKRQKVQRRASSPCSKGIIFRSAAIHQVLKWQNQCTMSFPMEIEMFEILNYYFSSRWCKVVQILEWIFRFTYFVKYVQSYIQNTWRGVWRVWNLVCRAARLCLEKKFKIAFFSEQPFIEQISSEYFLPIVSSKHLKGQLGPLVNHVMFFNQEKH